MPNSDPVPKKLRWLKWIVGSVAAVFVAGYLVSERISSLASTDELDAAIRESSAGHTVVHEKLETRMERLDERTQKMYADQRVSAERQKLIDSRIELLLLQRQGTLRGTQARRLAAKIERQEARVVAVEQEMNGAEASQ